jgi:hypothetical protein
MSPPPHLGTSHPIRSNSSSMQQISNHKRSLSFNHHLSYNQVQAQQQSMLAHQQHPAFMKPSTPQHQLLSQRKEIAPISPSIKSAQVKSELMFYGSLVRGKVKLEETLVKHCRTTC